MTQELIKKAVKEAEDSLKDKQIQEVKNIVLKTLEKINKLDKEIDKAKAEVKNLEEQKKVLRMDIDDMKEGRLDRIAERQEKDEEAKKISVVVIIKEKDVINNSPWYWPYTVVWNYPIERKFPDIVYTKNNTADVYSGGSNFIGYVDAVTSSNASPVEINCSIAKYSTIGTYDVEGNVINLR